MKTFKYLNAKIIFRGMIAFMLTAVLLPAAKTVYAADGQWYTVKNVLSGDRMELNTGTVIRYAGITAPDPESRSEVIQGYAEEATLYNRQLIEGKRIRVEWGPRLKASDGSYAPFVFLEDGTLANQKMLESGYAKLTAEPPFSKYIDQLQEAARLSRFRGEGLWVHEDENKRRVAVIGNINNKKYYFPDDPAIEDVPKPQLREFAS
ncbi:MAG: thermonuclease family protein, partial [Candidatus Omnitrophica bacterium]|nr:thermonuclease family protein [Candidatus Omnitrophota bacterium]